MTSIAEALKYAQEALGENGVVEARRESVSLLAFALRKDKTFVYAHPEYSLTDSEEDLFDSYLRRRSAREPFQYITGVQEFFGLEFEVTPDVLIPRPETEMVVENAVKILGMIDQASFCEIGVGSGCISVSILHELKSTVATGVDVSADAIAITRRNAEKHSVSGRLTLLESDVFASLANAKFDAIISNPPYVPVVDLTGLQAELRFEPNIALTDGSDGLSIIRRIVTEAPQFLNPHGYLMMEIGFDQSEKVAAMFKLDRWQSPELLPDLQGIPRLVVARLK